MGLQFDFGDPALTFALALAAGMVAQLLAQHLRIPGIVPLLAFGLVLGPDVLGVVRPDSLGLTLQTLVGFAVAVILFEGGMNLNLRRLRHEARSIQQLVTAGALVTAAGGAISARLLLGWDWGLCFLFGSLVIVTGPTVIGPMLKRVRPTRSVATVLEAEGVLIDAIGAIVAVVTLEVLLGPAGGLAFGPGDLLVKLGFGAVTGGAAGYLLALVLRSEKVIPEGLENVLVLSLVLALYQGSNALLPETGIVTVTAAGLAVGNAEIRKLADLKEFKEQLTVLLIGMLFVLLAADVRLAEIGSLGWPGVLTVLALMLVVRPLNVIVGTFGSDLSWKERTFLSWMAPRGIVAAAISSLFAQELEAAGIAGGPEMRALVFLVIAATVLIQGLTGSPLARLLDLRRPRNYGYALLGANQLGLAYGQILRRSGQETVFIDSNPDACRAAEDRGFRVLFGSALAESVLARADVESRAACLAVTSNDEANLLFARKARDELKVPEAWIALRSGHTSVTPKMVQEAGIRVLFGEPRNIDLWTLRLERHPESLETWTRDEAAESGELEEVGSPPDPDRLLLPLALRRGAQVLPFESGLRLEPGDELSVVLSDERRQEAEAWLAQMGWKRLAGAAENG